MQILARTYEFRLAKLLFSWKTEVPASLLLFGATRTTVPASHSVQQVLQDARVLGPQKSDEPTVASVIAFGTFKLLLQTKKLKNHKEAADYRVKRVV